MKISKTKLHQIISEEVASLVEAPVSKTIDWAQEKRRKARGVERDLAQRWGMPELGDTDTKTYQPPPPRKKPQVPGADDPWGLNQIRQQRADVAAGRGGTLPMGAATRKAAVEKARKTVAVPGYAHQDPDKTIARSKDAPETDARDEAERELAAAQVVTHRSLADPKRISILNFDSDARDELVEKYGQKAGISLNDIPLGWGEFGIVYED